MTDSYFGLADVQNGANGFSATGFQIEQAMRQARTAIPVKVVAVSGGGTGAPPTVDVLPLVNQVDGQGNRTEHTTVFGIPCLRTHGGGNAIICDPQVGDVGMMVIADRDISSVKSTAAQANPGSRRIHSMADGVYVASMLMGSPSQYIQFTTTGMRIVDMNGNTIVTSSSGVTITTTKLRVEGDIEATGEVTAKADGGSVGLSTHTHSHGPAPDAGS